MDGKVTMKGLSAKELGLISTLEFEKKYFFTTADIDAFVKNKTQRYNLIKNLVKKKRIVKLNKSKYFLIPIKAKTGGWSEHPLIVIDEMMNGKNYFVGGWAAANYWRLTDQIPFQYDVYTTKRQGQTTLFHARIVFHRTSKKRISQSTVKIIHNHSFRIARLSEMKTWIQLRE